MTNCIACDRPMDRPPAWGCPYAGKHAEPDLAQSIAEEIEQFLRSRPVLDLAFRTFRPDDLTDMRDRLALLLRDRLKKVEDK